jgi:hypothetical protein
MTERFIYRPEHDATIQGGVARGLNSKQVAEELTATFGVNFNSDMVTSRMRTRAFKSLGDIEASPEDRFEAQVRRERDKAMDLAIAREMASAAKQQARWDEFLDIARDAFALTPRADLVQQLVIPQGSGTPETMVVLIGDIHIGKLADPTVVGSEFGYGLPIFEQRLARLKNRILRLYGLHSKTSPITKLVIYFLGDGVDGVDMRRGHQARTDINTASAQMLLLVTEFERMVRELEANLGIEIAIVWEFGNHGRVGDFGVNLPADNWDYVAGQVLAIGLRDLIADGKVKLHADTLKYSVTQLGPLRVYSSHNDAIKGGDGFSGLPINGMARGAAKDTGLHKQLFDLHLVAHFHTPQDVTFQTGREIMNGAWDGGDDYSVNGIKAASDPIQWAFGVHPENGITWQSRIVLTPNAQTRKPTPAIEL